MTEQELAFVAISAAFVAVCAAAWATACAARAKMASEMLLNAMRDAAKE